MIEAEKMNSWIGTAPISDERAKEGIKLFAAALAEAREAGVKEGRLKAAMQIVTSEEVETARCVAFEDAARKLSSLGYIGHGDAAASVCRALAGETPTDHRPLRIPSIELLTGCMVENQVLRQIAEGIHRSLSDDDENDGPQPPNDER